MGQLRDRMEQGLKLRGLSPSTIRNYLLYCGKFAAFSCAPPLGTRATHRSGARLAAAAAALGRASAGTAEIATSLI
jgi:hypothetical protein